MRLLHFFGVALVGGLMVTVVQAAEPAEERTLSSTLPTFVHAVLEDNPQLLAARSAVDAAQARTRAAGRPLYNPELELDAETARAIRRAWVSHKLSIGRTSAVHAAGSRRLGPRLHGPNSKPRGKA